MVVLNHSLWSAGPVRTAALINGAAAHTMEVDDIYRDAVYHPGPPVISSVLAASQSIGSDGVKVCVL